jgi:hypothetical protein
MPELIARATRRAAREAWVETTLREIEADFDNAGIEQGELPADKPISGERRTLVEKYYATVDWSSNRDVRRVLDAFESLLSHLGPYRGEQAGKQLIKALNRDHFSYVDGKIISGIPVADVQEEALNVDMSQLRASVDRIRAAVEQDPSLAVGSAKELVEATCKAILTDAGEEIPENAKLPQLVTLVAKELDLLPADVSDSTEGAASIRRVVGSLATTVQGLAELRNLFGTGHGKAPGHPMLAIRHARLCAGAASTLSTFLMETASERRGA